MEAYPLLCDLLDSGGHFVTLFQSKIKDELLSGKNELMYSDNVTSCVQTVLSTSYFERVFKNTFLQIQIISCFTRVSRKNIPQGCQDHPPHRSSVSNLAN